jgi:RNA polymerase sigma factor (sigma-70 family)
VTSDGEIIRRSLAVPSAFAELFDRHARVLGAFVSRRLGSDAAEDIVSETFLTAFRRRASFDLAVDSARPWLFGIAVRLIRRHRAGEAAHWRSILSAATHAGRSHDGGIGEADARADAAASLSQLAPALRALSARDRETLQLYAWSELTYEEVASVLGVPVGTVKSRLNRVRRRLAASRDGDGQKDQKEENHGSAPQPA